MDPRDPLMNLNLDVWITDFILSDLNIYSRHYLGSSILRGDMDYRSNTRIRDGQLSSENKLVIEHVEVGEKEGGLHDLPLKFALFLLKDREGVVNLDVPVRGDLKNPEVSVGKIEFAYALARMKQVDRYLKSMNDSTAIAISRSHADAPGNVDSIPRFEVNYSMQKYQGEN